MRARIDWKYLLGLALTDPGFDASVLSEFRSRLVVGAAEALLFDTLLDLCRERGLLTKRWRQRTDATHVLGAVRGLNRLGCAIETLRAALNALAIATPDWLRAHADPAWIERYGRSIDDFHIPQGEAARRACAEEVGSDGYPLLVAIDAGTATCRPSRSCVGSGCRTSTSPRVTSAGRAAVIASDGGQRLTVSRQL